MGEVWEIEDRRETNLSETKLHIVAYLSQSSTDFLTHLWGKCCIFVTVKHFLHPTFPVSASSTCLTPKSLVGLSCIYEVINFL
jgi:hypothetical protein